MACTACYVWQKQNIRIGVTVFPICRGISARVQCRSTGGVTEEQKGVEEKIEPNNNVVEAAVKIRQQQSEEQNPKELGIGLNVKNLLSP